MEIALNLDCNDIDRMEAFWTAALGYRKRGSLGSYRAYVPESGNGLTLILQLVPETKTVAKNRLHLDLNHDKDFDIEAEATRMESLGARRISGVMSEGVDDSWIVMADPEGNEFCVCAG